MAKKAKGDKSGPGLPSKEAILEFVKRGGNADDKKSGHKIGKREIARAFGVRGDDRVALKKLLAEMARDGTLVGNRKAMKQRGGLPPVAVLEIVGRDDDGELLAEPVTWAEDGERPRARLEFRDPAHSVTAAELAIGDRVLARVRPVERDAEDADGDADDEDDSDDADDGIGYVAQPMKKLPREKRRLIGIFRRHAKGGGRVLPVDRKELRDWPVVTGDEGGAGDGDLVRFDMVPRGRTGTAQARILESLGNPHDQRQISLIAIHAHGLPDAFPDAVMAEAEGLAPAALDDRTDLRALPLLTIDPVDARDHDDAVHAATDTDRGNPGGFIVTVAIADVAYYVRPNSKVDREAQGRANSVYFPDRVVPMLPERLSNDLCSLREGEDRPCLVVRMVFDRRGKKRSHVFMRAMMRSAAKLSYQEAQAAIDGEPSDKCLPLLEPVLRPLWAAYAVLTAARDAREPLDLDLPERKIILDAEGRVARVTAPERLPAHRLIEEFMIQANVAAAETLEQRKAPVVYRVHEPPSKEKLTSLHDFLDSLSIKFPAAGQLKPDAFNAVLSAVRGTPMAELVNEVVLRSQAQADYRPENAGHFGLNLSRYAHFTSPIRRYADLLVHRSLVRALGLGEGGLEPGEAAQLKQISQKISEAERRSMAAERETTDRLIASHLADRVGAEFAARISGVTRSGLFVRLRDTGADGFIPISTLGNDYFTHAEGAHALIGSRSGLGWRLGDNVTVRLVEAIPTAGALRFEMVSEARKGLQALLKSGGGGGGKARRPPRPRRRGG